MLDLGLAAGQVHIDDGELVDAGRGFLVRLLDAALGAESLRNTGRMYNTELCAKECAGSRKVINASASTFAIFGKTPLMIFKANTEEDRRV